MSKVRTDFYFTYSSEKLKAARERLRISQGETARRAQIRDGTYNGYERGATKTISGSNACKVALALRCEVSELFDNYEAARLHMFILRIPVGRASVSSETGCARYSSSES